MNVRFILNEVKFACYITLIKREKTRVRFSLGPPKHKEAIQMIVYRVLDSEKGGYIDTSADAIGQFVTQELTELCQSSKLIIHVEEMEEDKYKALPEFDGF